MEILLDGVEIEPTLVIQSGCNNCGAQSGCVIVQNGCSGCSTS